jgi:hypothetical protein
MTEDDYRSIFLGRLADFGKQAGATVNELGFAEDCRMQFNYTKRQQHWIDSLMVKYQDTVDYLATGKAPLSIQAKMAVRTIPIPEEPIVPIKRPNKKLKHVKPRARKKSHKSAQR